MTKHLVIGLLAIGGIVAADGPAAAQLFDVNDAAESSPTQAGWTAADSTNINGVTFTAVGMDIVGEDPVTIDDRLRPGPYGGAESDMWLDFIFANGSNSEGSGMDVAVEGFTPNSVYNVKIWAFDTSSANDRSMTWNRTVYTFDGSDAEPQTLDEYAVTVPAIADGSGKLLLEGRTNLALSNNNQHNVFINGFEVQDMIDTLSLEVNTTTGNVKIVNAHDAPFDLNYYEVLSASGSLDASGWDPLDPTPGGPVDETTWEAAIDNSSPAILSEVNLRGMATVGNSDQLDLGAAYDGGAQDVQFWYAAPDGNLVPGPVVYVSGGFEADFDSDGDVDADDLNGANGWQARFGDGLAGEDFINWQREYPAGGGGASAVPEPASLALLGAGLALCCTRRRR